MDLSTISGFKGWMEITSPDDPAEKVTVHAATFAGGGINAETGQFHDHDGAVSTEGQRERDDITITQGLSRSLASDVVQKLDRWAGFARCVAVKAELQRGTMQPYPWRYTGILKSVSSSDRQKGESGGAVLTVVMACDADLA